MRVILIITFLLKASLTLAQEKHTLSLENALYSVLNNPEAKSDSKKKVLSSNIKASWYLYLYQINTINLLQEHDYCLADLERIIKLKYQLGETDYLEYFSLLGNISDIEEALVIAQNEVEMTRISLQQLLFTNDEIFVSDSSLSMYEIDKGSLYNIYDIDTIPFSSDSITRYQHFIHDKTIEYKQLELDNLYIQIHFYNAYRLPYAETLINTAKARYKTEEIDYIEFTNLVAEAFKIRLNYLSVLNNYNQFAIKLELYAY
jgi:hypothetical protein